MLNFLQKDPPCVRFHYIHQHFLTACCIYHSYCCDDNHPNSIPRTLGMLPINTYPLPT